MGGEWEEVDPNEFGSPEDDTSTPFGGVARPDGLVYSPVEESPELRVPHSHQQVPLPPSRPSPQRPATRPSAPWQPGPAAKAVKVRSEPRFPWVALLAGLIPVAVLAGMAFLVYLVATSYGYQP